MFDRLEAQKYRALGYDRFYHLPLAVNTDRYDKFTCSKEYKGDIYIDNVNIKDINQNSILNNITYISQNNYLINDTLKNNIT